LVICDVVSRIARTKSLAPAPHFENTLIAFVERRIDRMDALTWQDVAAKAAKARALAEHRFDYARLGLRFADFVMEVLNGAPSPPMRTGKMGGTVE